MTSSESSSPTLSDLTEDEEMTQCSGDHNYHEVATAATTTVACGDNKETVTTTTIGARGNVLPHMAQVDQSLRPMASSEALSYFIMSSMPNPSTFDEWMSLVAIYYGLGDLKSAEVAMRSAMQQFPPSQEPPPPSSQIPRPAFFSPTQNTKQQQQQRHRRHRHHHRLVGYRD